MAEVSRLSTFPPILRSYHSGIFTSSEPFRPLQEARSPPKPPKGADQQAISHPPATRKKGQRGVEEAKQEQHPSSGLLTTDKIRRENELELRRKRNQVSYS